MEIKVQETSTRKPTGIPRLRKKSSFDSALSGCSNDHAQENPLNRCSSDPNHQANKADKNKKLFKFTLKEKLLNCTKNDDGTLPNNNDTDDEINSAIFSGRSEDKHAKHEKEQEEMMNESILLHKQNQTTNNNSASTMTSTGTLVQTQIECSCQTLTPNSGQNIKIKEDQVNSVNPPSFNQFLKEAYIKQIGKNAGRQEQILDQSCWNIMNPLYKSVALGEESKFKANLVSDVNVEKLANHKEESSDFETEEDTLIKDNSSQTNTRLLQFYKSLTAQKSNPSETSYSRKESLVKAFFHMLDNDSTLIPKLRKDSKMDNRFKKFRNRLQRKEPQNNSENCKSKLIQDLYKNEDVYSSITHSSVDNWSSYHCSPKRCTSKLSSRRRSSVSVKGCGCEIRHLQLNDVQNSITDIQNGMKAMLANYSPTTNEEIALELVRMRIICDECIAYHRKAVLQNKKLQNEVQSLCETISKLMESKKSRSYLKLLMLPILGFAAYFVVKNYELLLQNPKIPVVDDE